MAVDDSYTKALLHFEGNIIDESGKSWTASGGAATSIVQKKFGNASIDFVKSSGQYISTNASADFYFEENNFTIDFWGRWKSHAGTDNLYVFFLDNAFNPSLFFAWAGYQGTNKIRCGNSLTTSGYITSDYTLYDNVWNHYALIRNGNTLTLYIDGVSNGAINCSGISYGDSTSPLRVGGYPSYAYCDMFIDEFRISKGIARWTANFTPPTAAYGLTGINPQPILIC